MTGQPVLVLGAESELGAEIARALAGAGCTLALVSSTPEADAAFRVQRLAGKLGAVSQAIDATNEMAVRVMVRQVAKQLGGLVATIVCPGAIADERLIRKYAGREMDRLGGGVFLFARTADDALKAIAGGAANR